MSPPPLVIVKQQRLGSGGNNNNNNSISNSGSGKNGGGGHPMSHISELQQPVLLGRSSNISSTNTTNGRNNHHLKHGDKEEVEEEEGLLDMLLPANNNHDASNNNNDSRYQYQFHVNAIRALLLDTPLPLEINNTTSTTTTTNLLSSTNNNNNNTTMIVVQPRQPKRNEHIYLLPRIYMRKWCNWTRNDVIISCVDEWLMLKLSSSIGSGSGDNATTADVVVFELPQRALQTLAALSVISDQYQLYANDDDDDDNNEDEWKRWLDNVKTCWMDWITCVNERRLLSLLFETSIDDDEKKEDVIGGGSSSSSSASHNEGVIEASRLFREMFQTSSPPGAIDALLLTRKNKPLQLRRNVSLVMRGMNAFNTNNTDGEEGGNRNVLTVQQEMKDEVLIDYLDSSETDNEAPHLAVNPVPSSFYELLRQTFGVICEDLHTISYQPAVATKNGGADNGLSLLCHDKWKSDPPSPRHKNASMKNMDIHYPSSSKGETVNSTATHTPLQSTVKQVARPIEFRRRFLTTALGGGQSTRKPAPVASPTYATLLKEATQSKRESQSGNNKQQHDTGGKLHFVEVYPVEFHYAIIDGVSSPLPPAAVTANSLRYSQQGMALASRASLAKNVLHELERAASPGRSSACIRLWMKSRPYADVQAGVKSATKNGDGFDLIDMDSLVIPAAPKKQTTPTTPPRAGSKSNDRLLTVGEWLKIDLTQPQSQKSRPVVVELLIEIRSSPTARWIRESLELENRLQVGDFVDAQDLARQWYEAIVREITPDTVKVHYFGWGSKWDTILPLRKGAAEGKLKSRLPPAPLWSKTSRWREQIKVGDEVEVRESSSIVQRPKWHRATVLAVGRETDPPRELVGGAELESLEDNGNGKKVSLLLLSRKRQILVEVPQERLSCPSPLPTVRRKNDDGLPLEQPPFIRWVNLYSEEICQVNTHQTRVKQESETPVTASYVMESKRELVEVMKPFNNIHGSGFVRESLRGMPIATGSVGLHNLGNSW
jgi:hypothetical protein